MNRIILRQHNTYVGKEFVDNVVVATSFAEALNPVEPGDFNGDGNVDAADYVMWRKDPSGFGGDPAGYVNWRSNFDNTPAAAGGLGGPSLVPEPATIALLTCFCVFGVLQRPRRIYVPCRDVLMTKTSLLSLLFCTTAISISAVAALAGTIANWTFETSPPTTATQAPDVGSGTGTVFHTAAGATYTNPSGNGSAESWNTNTWSSGDYFQFQVSTLGEYGITFGWDQTRSTAGPGVSLLGKQLPPAIQYRRQRIYRRCGLPYSDSYLEQHDRG